MRVDRGAGGRVRCWAAREDQLGERRGSRVGLQRHVAARLLSLRLAGRGSPRRGFCTRGSLPPVGSGGLRSGRGLGGLPKQPQLGSRDDRWPQGVGEVGVRDAAGCMLEDAREEVWHQRTVEEQRLEQEQARAAQLLQVEPHAELPHGVAGSVGGVHLADLCVDGRGVLGAHVPAQLRDTRGVGRRGDRDGACTCLLGTPSRRSRPSPARS